MFAHLSSFPDDMLRPEFSLEEFVEGIENIALRWKNPPRPISRMVRTKLLYATKAILQPWCMAATSKASNIQVRRLFDREYVLESDWYRTRLDSYREQEIAHVQSSISYLKIPSRSSRAQS